VMDEICRVILALPPVRVKHSYMPSLQLDPT